jgi:DNA-binding transcriptional ArsR family regulator
MQPDHCAELLKALGDPMRLRIVDVLRQGPQCVSELADRLDSDLPLVSHHLGILRNARLIEKERHGRFIHYRLNEEVYKATKSAGRAEHLNLGCCRIEIPRDANSTAERAR